MEEKYDIFLSYRRDTGFHTAKILYEMLKNRGYRVFMDVEALRTGNFNKKLYSVIEMCTDFILILSKDCLDRCVNDDDWVRNEISHAIKLDKNIVPVQVKGFTEPTVELPPDIKNIVNYNRLMPTEQLFNEAVEKMCGEFIRSVPKTGTIRETAEKKTKKPKTKKMSRKIFIFSVIMSILSLIASFIISLRSIGDPSRNSVRRELSDMLFIIFIVFGIAALISGICCLIKKIASRINSPVSEGSNISIDMFSLSSDELLQNLMLLPGTDLISGTVTQNFDYAGHSECFKRENYRTVRELRNVVIASRTGGHIDYVFWLPDNTYSFLSLKRSMKAESISEVLPKQGFFFKKRIETGIGSCKIIFGNDSFKAILDVNSDKIECVEIIRKDN